MEVLRAVAFGQMDDQPGSEILTIENQSGRARVLTLDRSGTDEADKRGRLAFFALPQGNERGRSLALGDLDGDGRQDVVVTDPSNAQVWAYLQSGKSGLGAGQTFPSLVGARTVHLADLDGDRKDEVYVLSRAGEADRPERVRPRPVELPDAAADQRRAGRRWTLADLDGDKVARDPLRRPGAPKPGAETFELRAIARDKSGSFRPYRWSDAETVRPARRQGGPRGDRVPGRQRRHQADLIIFNEYGPPQLLLGKKGGAAAAVRRRPGPLDRRHALRRQPGGPRRSGRWSSPRTPSRGGSCWTPGATGTSRTSTTRGGTRPIILGAAALDTDGDGKKEVVLFDRTSKSLLFLSQKDGVYRPGGSLPVGSINFQGMHVADFDGDGRDDLLIAGSDRFGVLQTGQKGLRLKTIASYESRRNEARLSDLAAGDVNGDGIPDVVFVDIGEQSLEIASFAGDKDLVPAITFPRLRAQDLPQHGRHRRAPRPGPRRRGRRRPDRYRHHRPRPRAGLSPGSRHLASRQARPVGCQAARRRAVEAVRVCSRRLVERLSWTLRGNDVDPDPAERGPTRSNELRAARSAGAFHAHEDVGMPPSDHAIATLAEVFRATVPIIAMRCVMTLAQPG